MKFDFTIRYEVDAPLAICVAVYLDSEHYVFLHRALTNRIQIIEKSANRYRCNQSWSVLGLQFGQTYTCRYEPPATFINEELTPYPFWLPSIHHLIRTKTTLHYYETPRRTTLSELTVEMDMPPYLFPFRQRIRTAIEKIKILKDLEDVALIDRRTRLFGRDNNTAYLKGHQFLLHKESYVKYFGPQSRYLGNPQDVVRDESWPDITRLDHGYVRDFLRQKYFHFAGFEFTT